METWLEIDEFCEVVGLSKNIVQVMIDKNELTTKIQDSKTFVLSSKNSVVLSGADAKVISTNEKFANHAIGTILNMHEKVIDAKDETLEALKSENRFLKEALFSMQELYDEDRKTFETLQKQLKISQDEVEFLKRKYKLMWNKAVENYKKEE